MSTTVSNYLSRINQNFPVRGQDNDSQGFRDNFHNIHEAIKQVNSEVENLDLYTIKTNDTATFYGNTIEDVNFKNQSIELYSLDIQSGAIEIDYGLGSYQKFEVTSGVHDLSVVNWPGAGKSGKITLSITAASDAYTAINFNPGYTNLSAQINPVELTNTVPNIFEVWSEEGSDTVFYKYITDFTYDSNTTTSVLWANKFKLGQLNNNSNSLAFFTGTGFTAVVENQGKSANLALVPERIKIQLTNQTVSAPHYTFFVSTATSAVSRLIPGATFVFNGTNTSIYTVTSVVTATGAVSISPGGPSVPDSELTSTNYVTFVNPTFTSATAGVFPTMVTMVDQPANTFTGVASAFKGSVYANKNRLEVTYNNYGNNNTNTFVVQTIATSTAVSYYNQDLVDTTFVHSILPIGSVIMWYGKKTEIPGGWVLCDGRTTATIINGVAGPTIRTPNLSNRFVVGAETDYLDGTGKFQGPGSTVTSITTTTGGISDAIVPQHSHSASFTGAQIGSHSHTASSPAHDHAVGGFSYILKAPYAGSLTGNDTVNSGSEQAVGPGDGAPMASVSVTINIDSTSSGISTGTVTVANTGTSSTGTNVPPFTALYYIMKISGYISTSSGIVV